MTTFSDTMSVDEITTELSKAFDSFKAEHQKRLDEIEKKVNRPSLGGEPIPGAESKAALSSALRKFIGKDDDAELKGMSVGSDPAGGYTVIPELSLMINSTAKNRSPIRQLARVITLNQSDVWEEIIDNDDVDAAWVGETDARAETAAGDLRKLRIPAHEIYANPKVTQKLLDDSQIDLATWLVGKVGDKFSRTENAAFVTGNGVSKPRGFATYDTAATDDDTRAWGVVQHVVSGANGGFASSNPADKLLELVYTLKSEYQDVGTWLMPREVAMKVRQFKDGQGRYIWSDPSAGQPATLFGFPVALSQDMPALDTGSLSIAFGDWERFYTIVDRAGLRLLRDPYTAKPHVLFYCYRRVGGDIADFNAVKFLKFSAS